MNNHWIIGFHKSSPTSLEWKIIISLIHFQRKDKNQVFWDIILSEAKNEQRIFQPMMNCLNLGQVVFVGSTITAPWFHLGVLSFSFLSIHESDDGEVLEMWYSKIEPREKSGDSTSSYAHPPKTRKVFWKKKSSIDKPNNHLGLVYQWSQKIEKKYKSNKILDSFIRNRVTRLLIISVRLKLLNPRGSYQWK